METAVGKSIINIKSVVNFGGIEVASFFPRCSAIYFATSIHTHVGVLIHHLVFDVPEYKKNRARRVSLHRRPQAAFHLFCETNFSILFRFRRVLV